MKKRNHTKMWKRLSCTALLIVLCSSALLGGCGQEREQADIGGGQENTLVYASQDYTAINPALYEHGEIHALLFAGLTAHDAENQVVPALAEDWTFDEDSLTWTFHLREGLTFHDGEPLTSADVAFTLNAILDEENMSEIVSNYTDIAAIDCPDALTVKIRLKEINVAFPDYMTIGILPEHLLKGETLPTCSFNQHPVGAGPYKLVDWDMGQSITMARFEGYYGGTPEIETVIFRIAPDSDSRALLLASGDVDMAQITPKYAQSLLTNDAFAEKYNIYQMETADYRAIAYNFNAGFFADRPELANILSYAIDREAIVEGALLGQGVAAYSPLQKGKYVQEAIEKFSYNPEKCMALLEADGWKKGEDGYYAKDGQQLAFTISAMADDQVRVDMATMCAAQLQEIGVNATAEAKISLDWVGQDCCMIGWGSPFDPDDHTYKVFTTDAGDNYTGYSNAEVDRLLAAARHTTDDSQRRKLYGQFQEEMTKAMPYTFIAYVDADYAVRKGISGITPDTVLGHHGVGVFWNIAQWRMGKKK